MLKDNTLRWIFSVSVGLTIVLPLVSIAFIYPAFERLVVRQAVDDAFEVAKHLKPRIVFEGDVLRNSEKFAAEVANLQDAFNIMKIKIFREDGRIVFSTDPADIGEVNTKSYFRDIVAKGRPYAKVVEKKKRTLDDRVFSVDVAETYIPIFVRDRFVGALEIYYDVDERRKELGETFWRSLAMMAVIMFSFMTIIFYVLRKADRNITRRAEAEKALREAHAGLEIRVRERTKELFYANLELEREIADRARAEEGLRESEERFRRLFEESVNPAILFGRDAHDILDLNASALALFGEEKKKLIEGGLGPFVSADDLACLSDHIKAGGTGKGAFVEPQVNMRRRDGSPFVVAINGRLIGITGKPVTYCVFSDITEKLDRYEAWSMNMQRLMHADKMTFLGTMVSGFAHDINNPNQLIRVNIQLIEDFVRDAIKVLGECCGGDGELRLGGLPYSEIRDNLPAMLADVRSGSDRISRIVKSLMDFAREDAAAPRDELDVNHLIEECLVILRHKIKQCTDRFHFAPGEGIPPVKGNQQRLEQVLANLIVNALEALPTKDAAVSVFSRYDGRKHMAEISVSDEGVGMAPEVMARVFEPFYTTKHTSGGTGLGLAISQVFVREHAGEMSFESTPGKGTTVTLRLPVNSE